jgi:hypothetical protein
LIFCGVAASVCLVAAVANFVVACVGGGAVGGTEGLGDRCLTVEVVVFIFCMAFDSGIDGQIFMGFIPNFVVFDSGDLAEAIFVVI